MKKFLVGFVFVATLSVLSTGCGDVDVTLGATLCEDMCERQAAVACGSFNRTTCERSCRDLYDQRPQCEAQLTTAIRCGISSGYTCERGLVRTVGCEAEGQAMITCVSSGARASSR